MMMSRAGHIAGALATTALLLCHGCGSEECSSDADCDDGIFCNGAEYCQEGRCQPRFDFPCDDDLACTIDECDEATHQCKNTAPDADGDGHTLEGCLGGDDCNDRNPNIHPGVSEQCNGVDDDCDGVVQEDTDGDRHYSQDVCPEGDDCDDNDAKVYPGSPEVCDGVDNNCVDGTDDESDTDRDGHIDTTCGGDDCDDEKSAINPGVAETCNGKDDNCNGECDEDFDCCQGTANECTTSCGSVGSTTCSSACTLSECQPPVETCNNRDDDCDGQIDEDLPCQPGELVECTTVCESTGRGTCLDTCEVPPPEECMPPQEECNGADDDCDGETDETFACLTGTQVVCVTECGSHGNGTCTDQCRFPSPENCTPPAEQCHNDVDDDCDGSTDEFCY